MTADAAEEQADAASNADESEAETAADGSLTGGIDMAEDAVPTAGPTMEDAPVLQGVTESVYYVVTVENRGTVDARLTDLFPQLSFDKPGGERIGAAGESVRDIPAGCAETFVWRVDSADGVTVESIEAGRVTLLAVDTAADVSPPPQATVMFID